MHIGKRNTFAKLRPIDAIETGPRHLQKSQSVAGCRHLPGEGHRNENVDLAELSEDLGLIAGDDLTGDRQPFANGLDQAYGKRSGERGFQLSILRWLLVAIN